MSTRQEFLPYALPLIEEDDIAEVVDTLKSGWLAKGPKTTEFEKQFANYVGAKYAVALSSCTAALHLSLVAAGTGAADQVITAPLPVAPSAHVARPTGAKPV